MSDGDSIKSLRERIKKADLKRKKGKNLYLHKVRYYAFRYLADFVAVILLAFILGRFLDEICGPKPLFFIICIIMGFLGIFKNIWREVVEKKDV